LRVVVFWPVGLSVILLPQSRGFDDGVFYLGVSDGGVVSCVRFYVWGLGGEGGYFHRRRLGVQWAMGGGAGPVDSFVAFGEVVFVVEGGGVLACGAVEGLRFL